MARELKFKAWSKRDSAWYMDGSAFDLNYSGGYGDFYFDNDHPADIRGADLVWCQFTGLKDSEGREIYEGDIIVGRGYPWFDDQVPNYVAVVEWITPAFCTVKHCVNPSKRGISSGIAEMLEEDESWKVIGNIYEHPALLGTTTAWRGACWPFATNPK